jgi:hypothetical protein
MAPRSLVLCLCAGLAGALLVSAPPAVAVPGHPASSASSASSDSVVAPGSYLAVVEKGPDGEYGGIDARAQRLVLVSATGETRTVYTRRVSGTFGGFVLLDWSLDGRTALLTATKRNASQVIVVDVETGAVHELVVPLLQTAVLDPAGSGIVASVWKGPRSETMTLDRISWTGTRTTLRSGVSGQLTPGRNGTVLTTDAARGRVQLLLSGTDGAVVNRFRGEGYCTPVRWWDATRVLERCEEGDLYLVDPATGVSDRLTSQHGRGDYGHLDARPVASRLYVQVAGACGYTYVAKVAKRSTKPLDLPKAVGNVVMVDAVGDDLVLEHAASCDGDRPRSVLSLFDTVRREETPLLVLGRHESFGGILVLGEERAAAY